MEVTFPNTFVETINSNDSINSINYSYSDGNQNVNEQMELYLNIILQNIKKERTM